MELPDYQHTMIKIYLCLMLWSVTSAVGDGYGGYRRHGYSGYYYPPGFKYVPGGIAAVYRNDQRQRMVNYLAELARAGTGTALFYGVPGTGHDFSNGYGTYGYAPPTKSYEKHYHKHYEYGNGYHPEYGYGGGYGH